MRPSQQRPEQEQIVVSPVNNRVIRYRVDWVGNDLTATLRWCSTHNEPTWEFNDGSWECPHVMVIKCDDGTHVLVDPPWEVS